METTFSKEHILEEIRRVAAENGGKPPGIDKFRIESGVKSYEWQAHWVRWSEALVEAGFAPNQFSVRVSKQRLAKHYAELARELGHLPVQVELRNRRRVDSEFPNNGTFHTRFGSKRELIRAVVEHCKGRSGFEAVAELCNQYLASERNSSSDDAAQDSSLELFGSVYLAKSGRYYKIGRSNAAGRREYEIGLQLPEKLKMVHVITTDDPSGIEAYWHKRFGEKRKNGEWFELTASDVAAFKRRRKFM